MGINKEIIKMITICGGKADINSMFRHTVKSRLRHRESHP